MTFFVPKSSSALMIQQILLNKIKSRIKRGIAKLCNVKTNTLELQHTEIYTQQK